MKKLQKNVLLTSVLTLFYSLHYVATSTKLNLQIDQHRKSNHLTPDSLETVTVTPNENILENKKVIIDSFSNRKAKYDNEKQMKLAKQPVDGIPGIDRKKFKRKLYSLLGKIKTHPQAAIYALITGKVPRDHIMRFGKNAHIKRNNVKVEKYDISSKTSSELGSSSETFMNVTDSNNSQEPKSKSNVVNSIHNPQLLSERSPEEISGTRYPRVKRKSPGVMYLPINQPQSDPCAPPKGSKLMEALPLVFLSTVLSVADAVGNVLNNINNNNRNNNNNNDNNINNDNTNLAANINNANQINIVPFMGRALRVARTIMTSIGRMAIGAYDIIMPSAPEKVDDGELKDINSDANIQDNKKRGEVNSTAESDPNVIFNNTNGSLVKQEIEILTNSPSNPQTISESNSSSSSSSSSSSINQTLNAPFVFNISKMSSLKGLYDEDKITKRSPRHVQMLLQDDERDYILQLCTGSKRPKRTADVHLFENRIIEAENNYRNYLDSLKEQLKYI